MILNTYREATSGRSESSGKKGVVARADEFAKVNRNIELVMGELEKINRQQMRLMESLNSFQHFTKNEIAALKSRVRIVEDNFDLFSK